MKVCARAKAEEAGGEICASVSVIGAITITQYSHGGGREGEYRACLFAAAFNRVELFPRNKLARYGKPTMESE